MRNRKSPFKGRQLTAEVILRAVCWDLGVFNRVQFETRRFRVRSSLSEQLWKVGTTGF
jgi:hypothetical protein